MEIKFVKLRENSKLPFKKHTNDAGYDLSWCPNLLSDDVQGDRWVDGTLYNLHCGIKPGESVVLRTGLKSLFPAGYVMEIKNRSGIAAKKGLLIGACIVDSTYRGEIFVNLHNVSDKEQIIEPGDRIAQCIFYQIENVQVEEISEKEYDENETTRKDGGFGSTGIK